MNCTFEAFRRRTLLSALLLGVVTLGCIGAAGGNEAAASDANTNVVTSNVANANEELIEHGGCISCHRIDEKLIGPSFRQVAAKYRSSPNGAASHLFDAVRNGGEGVWGDLPMPETTAAKVSDADLKTLIEFILGLS